MKNLAIALLSIFLFSQCADKNSAKPKFDLIGTTWILRSGSGEATITGDLDGDGRDDDDIYPYDDFIMYEVGSQVTFQTATTMLLSNDDFHIHEEINYSITGDELRLDSDDWGVFYFVLKVTGNDMILDWDKATFTKTYGRAGVVINSSNIRYQLTQK